MLLDPGERGDELGARLASAQLNAPDHLPVEVAGVLRRLRNGGRLTTTEAGLAVSGFWTLPIQLWPFETLSDRAWELSANVSSYDAAYVALAERIGAPLLTEDGRLARAPGVRCEIELFG